MIEDDSLKRHEDMYHTLRGAPKGSVLITQRRAYFTTTEYHWVFVIDGNEYTTTPAELASRHSDDVWSLS